jgi:hypothetical protein
MERKNQEEKEGKKNKTIKQDSPYYEMMDSCRQP